MIKFSSRNTDQFDVGVLFAAMVVAEDEACDQFDVSLVTVGYDEALLRCRIAAAVLARDHVEEGDESDGCVWLEVMQSGWVGLALYLDGEIEDLLPHDRIARVSAVVHEMIRRQQGTIHANNDPLPAY